MAAAAARSLLLLELHIVSRKCRPEDFQRANQRFSAWPKTRTTNSSYHQVNQHCVRSVQFLDCLASSTGRPHAMFFASECIVGRCALPLQSMSFRVEANVLPFFSSRLCQRWTAAWEKCAGDKLGCGMNFSWKLAATVSCPASTKKGRI